MPDYDGSANFTFPDDSHRDAAVDSAHHIAYALASAALREGAGGLDEVITRLRDLICGAGEQVSEAEAVLMLALHRLAIFVRTVGGQSAHPLARNLRDHPTLVDAQAATVPDSAEDYLRRMDRLDELTGRLRSAFGIDPKTRP